MLGFVGQRRGSDLDPTSNGKPLKDFEQDSNRAAAFGNEPCDGSGSRAGFRQSGLREVAEKSRTVVQGREGRGCDPERC